ncbi:isocitrate dehydrogenase [NAD] subunit beta, mitochondrial-like [Manacus vitellinus]|uniref:isocitrate dehydrogenase [NAD] subunit beta, mitochondrial-like n=1 Tax=Manacus vitellinus TaxID=328815 RepID=UPI00115DC181|nr:isocitrate dehydrogenase [NAD] subunit beta, mitochondrial-like [Manacus vitellinus]
MEYKGDLASYDMRLRTLSSPSQGGAGDLLGGCAVCDPPCAPLCAPLCPQSVKGVIECLKIITRAKSQRIAKFAFDYATKKGRAKVTAVHKANIMKLGDGLFLQCCKEVAELYPKIKFDTMIIDNCCMQVSPQT